MHLNVSCKPYLKTEKWWQRGKKYLDIIKNSQPWWQQYIFLTLTTGPDSIFWLVCAFLPSCNMHDLSILTGIQVEEHTYCEIRRHCEIYHAFSLFHQQWEKNGYPLWIRCYGLYHLLQVNMGCAEMCYSIKLILVSLGLNKPTNEKQQNSKAIKQVLGYVKQTNKKVRTTEFGGYQV